MEVELHERQCEFVHRMFEVSEFAPVFKRLLGGNNDRNESHTAHVIYDSQFVCEARVVVVPSVSRVTTLGLPCASECRCAHRRFHGWCRRKMPLVCHRLIPSAGSKVAGSSAATMRSTANIAV